MNGLSLFPLVLTAACVVVLVAVIRVISRRQRSIFDLAEDVIEESLERSRDQRRRTTPPPAPPGSRGRMDFRCGHCGATQQGPMDVSPSGDVKCTYCNKWFNAHG